MLGSFRVFMLTKVQFCAVYRYAVRATAPVADSRVVVGVFVLAGQHELHALPAAGRRIGDEYRKIVTVGGGVVSVGKAARYPDFLPMYLSGSFTMSNTCE